VRHDLFLEAYSNIVQSLVVDRCTYERNMLRLSCWLDVCFQFVLLRFFSVVFQLFFILNNFFRFDYTTIYIG
jgi:hypothetical protein